MPHAPGLLSRPPSTFSDRLARFTKPDSVEINPFARTRGFFELAMSSSASVQVLLTRSLRGISEVGIERFR